MLFIKRPESDADAFSVELMKGGVPSGAWVVTAAGNYFVRDSELPVFEKDRFFMTFGLSRDF